MEKKPLLSICTTTYNHEKYIQQALDSFLMQVTDFEFEILINDDASTDKTALIVKEYEKKYPHIIKPTYQTVNQYSKGVRPMAELVYPRARGKYIALCEGDDYWTDPHKLQKQVDFLEANPEYGMISSDVILINKEGDVIPDNQMVLKQRKFRKDTIDIFDLLNVNIVNTLTVCVRTDIMQELGNRVINENLWFIYDYWIWLNVAINHKIKILYDKTAAYRVHESGISKLPGFLSKRNPYVLYDIITTYLNKHKSNKISYKNQLILLKKYFNIYRNKNSDKKMKKWALKKMLKSKYFILFAFNLLLKKLK